MHCPCMINWPWTNKWFLLCQQWQHSSSFDNIKCKTYFKTQTFKQKAYNLFCSFTRMKEDVTYNLLSSLRLWWFDSIKDAHSKIQMPISAGQQWLLLFVHYVLMPTPIMIQRERMTSRGNNTKPDSICKVGKKQTFRGEDYERGCSELKLEIPSKILAKKWQHNDTFEELRITNGWTEGLKWTHLQVTSKGWQAARIQKEKK